MSADYQPGRLIVVDDSRQSYRYRLDQPVGRMAPDFRPDLTPADMLSLGVFGGHYFEGEHQEYPADWFEQARLSRHHDPACNFFEIDASQPLSVWRQKGWIHPEDPRGWFQWYCRYYLGRRIGAEDDRQIKRWRQMKRHVAQLKKACPDGDWSCRRRQRQALLHWAYDSRNI